MNKSLFPAVFVTALCAACAQQPKDGFTLTGSAEGLDGHKRAAGIRAESIRKNR